MTKMTKRFGAAALAVLGIMVSTGYCKDAMEEMRAGTAGFETGMDIKEMISAQPLELAAPQPAAGDVLQADPFTTKAMEQADIAAVQAIIGRVNYMGKEEPGDCYSYEAVIESRVRSFNPAKWSIIFADAKNFTGGKQVVPLTDTEIRSMIAMFDRLHVASTRLADINLISEVTVKAGSCHTQPLVWMATYRKNPKFD